MQFFDQAVRIHASDNAAVALRDLSPGERIDTGRGIPEPNTHGDEARGSGEHVGGNSGIDRNGNGGSARGVDSSDGILTVRERIPAGHKFAWRDIAAGENVIKYGYPIGHALQAIPRGAWIHTHGVKTNLGDRQEYRYSPAQNSASGKGLSETGPGSGTGSVAGISRGGSDSAAGHGVGTSAAVPTFQGVLREDGRIGIRNEIWILPTVGCINKTAERLAQLADRAYGGSGIDGIFAFGHPYGCSQLGDDLSNTQKILSGLIRHPNAGGVLVLGLGCENNHIAEMKKVLGTIPENVAFLNIQTAADETEEGMALLEILVRKAKRAERRAVPLSRLKIGLKCGGSDGFSGITANPLIGIVTDRLVSLGGTAVLTEVPEMFGAETILMDRCVSREVFDKTVRLVNDFKSYFIRHGQTVYENPSPGNKEGGITTLEDKSLGCIQKGGTSPVVDVLAYGEQATANGLNLLNGPGNDLVSSTALAAAGAHMVLFSTGRGTPFGCPVPTVKIASNSDLAKRKPGWIDFNAGVLLEGRSADQTASELLDRICRIASGEPTQNERNGYREIAIFKDGVTL